MTLVFLVYQGIQLDVNSADRVDEVAECVIGDPLGRGVLEVKLSGAGALSLLFHSRSQATSHAPNSQSMSKLWFHF